MKKHEKQETKEEDTLFYIICSSLSFTNAKRLFEGLNMNKHKHTQPLCRICVLVVKVCMDLGSVDNIE